MDGFLDVTDARNTSHAPVEKENWNFKDHIRGLFAIIGCCVYLLLCSQRFFGELKPVLLGSLRRDFVISGALSGLAVVTFRWRRTADSPRAFSGQAQKKTVAVTMWCCLVLAEGWICMREGPRPHR